MTNDITRQLSASVYFHPILADKIISFAKNPFNAVVNPAGIDFPLLLKHALNAKNKEKTFYWLLFLPTAIFLIGFMLDLTILSFLSFIIIFIAVLIRHQNNKSFIKSNFLPNNFSEDFHYGGSGKELVSRLENKMTKNVVYCSGYSPFVGCGYEQGGWSFVIDIDRGKCDLGIMATPQDFQEDELYSLISKELLNLKLPNLTINDKIYFNGKKIRSNREILPEILSNPVTEVSWSFIKKTMNSGVENARFYKTIEIVGWEGDLVLTCFLRFQKNERTLFVENNYYILPPIKEEYRVLDRIKEESGIGFLFKRLISMITQTVVQSVYCILYVFRYLTKGINKLFNLTPEAALRKVVKVSPDYDYGSSTSIRQEVCHHSYFQHFQKLDTERYLKTIDKRIFKTIADFLESKDIDTSEFREREANVLNNGIIVNSGGSLTGGNISTGIGAAIKNIINPRKQDSQLKQNK